MMLSKDKEYIKNYNTEYYQKTKIKRLEDAKQRVTCDICNKEMSSSHKSKHDKSSIHRLNKKAQNPSDIPPQRGHAIINIKIEESMLNDPNVINLINMLQK